MAYDPSLFNVDPYYDDYSDDKSYLRVLFRPQFGVQGRELTQLQTISQVQHKRLGDHLFKDGSIVQESQVFVNSSQYIRTGSLTGYAGVKAQDFVGLTATVAGKNTIKILDTLTGLSGSTKDSQTIFVFGQYLNGPTAFAINDILSANLNGTQIYATITGGTSTYNEYAGAPDILPAFGDSTFIGIDSGIRYVKGFYVKHDKSKVTPYNIIGTGITAYRKFNSLNSTIKFNVEDKIITSDEDPTLNDPAFGSYNYNAPGADRYKINLALEHIPLSVTSQYTLVQIENGDVTYKTNYPEYNVLADTLARRTYDESGNYTVNNFPITVEDSSDENKVKIKIGPGKAYIFGYEFDNPVTKIVEIDKARDVNLNFESAVAFPRGNRVNLGIRGATGVTHTSFNYNSSEKYFISAGTGNGAFNQVGTTILNSFHPFGSGTVGYGYLSEFSLNPGISLTSCGRLFRPGLTLASQAVFDFINFPNVTLTNPFYDTLLYPLSEDVTSYGVKNISQIRDILIVRSTTKPISTGTNVFTREDFGFAAGDTWATFNSEGEFFVYSVTGSRVAGSGVIISDQYEFDTFADSQQVKVFAVFDINYVGSGTNKFWKTKTLSATSHSVIMRNSNGNEFAYLNGNIDVYDVLAITGQFGAGGQTTMTNVFELDTGQTDYLYDWSSIKVKKEHLSKGITGVSVTYRKFNRSTNIGPYVANSYSDFVGAGATVSDYKNIPVYTFSGRSGRTISLAGCADFRPDRITPSVFSISDIPFNYGATGSIGSIYETNNLNVLIRWDYYYPRTDKIVLSKDKTFQVFEGVSTNQALPPADRGDAMTLGTIFLNPYTKTYKDTSLLLNKNNRYTMKDIGNLDRRLERLEYYTTLSLSEKNAKNLEIEDANGLNKFKNGIFVDSFSSKQNSNYIDSDYSCAVDPERKEIRPKFNTRYIDFSLTGPLPVGLTQSSDGIITLNYSTEELISQKLASKSVNLNPFSVFNFNGKVTLSPQSDDWIDTSSLPDVLVNLNGENDGIGDLQNADFGTIWNNWETQWVGRTVGVTPWNQISSTPPASVRAPDGVWRQRIEQARLATQQTGQIRTGTKITLSPETISRSIGNRIVDVSIVPYMRQNSIMVKADGMRPNVRVYPFFDGINVSSYTSVNGVLGAAIITDAQGRVGYSNTIVFNLPSGMFRTGDKVFRLIDNSTNTLSSSTTTAEQTYSAKGLLQTQENTVVSTRNINVRREAVQEERVFGNIITEQTVQYIDPIAQTFLIDPLTYPSGIFVKKIEVFFRTKSSTLPVTLQLRPTVNGYPSSSTIIPFSEVYKLPNEVNISDDGTISTAFEFSSPVFLQPGEYAIALLSNSDEYEAWIAEIGQNEIKTNEQITSQPYAGSFFKSQNSSTWTAEQSLDLKFIIHKCNFSYNPSASTARFAYIEPNLSSGYTGIDNGINVFRLNSTYIEPSGTNIFATIDFPGVPSSEYAVTPTENYIFGTKYLMNDNLSKTIRANFELTNNASTSDVSPVLDTDRISGLYIQNILRIASDTKDVYEKLPTARNLTGSALDQVSLSRYLTKKINLQQGFESNSLDVIMDVRKPYKSDIRLYMKSQSPSDFTKFENIPYEKLEVHPDSQIKYNSYSSVGEDDFIEVRFSRGASGSTGPRFTSGVTGQSEFKNFQLKIAIDGDPMNSVVPAIRELKVIAT